MGLYQALINRWPHGRYSQAHFESRSYDTTLEAQRRHHPQVAVPWQRWCFSPNSTTPSARNHPKI